VNARGVTLRPVDRADDGFLFDVYASTRADELDPLGWDDAQRTAFLKMQFAAQTAAYRQEFPDAAFDIVLLDDTAAGRLSVDYAAAAIHVIDIALLPEFRNLGIASMLLGRLQARAAASRIPVRLYVERFNRALQLYTRLGFRVVDDAGVYMLMEWQPSAEDRLVADAVGRESDRHQEQVECAETLVLEAVGPLHQPHGRRPDEDS
jgi:ribosomal protein S18 acetylase RimI-like enzyme